MIHRILVRFAAVASVVLAVIGAVSPASAAGGYYRKGTFAVGGGFNFPVSTLDTYLNSSGTLYIAGGRNLNQKWTVQAEWTHNWLAIDPTIFNKVESDSVQFDNVYASQWSMTLNLVRRFNSDGDIVPWITGGGGYYKRNLQITQNTMVYFPPIYDPWWGWIDGGWAPGEAITGKREASGPGFNVGGGIDMSIESGASLFIDIRYHQANMKGVNMTYIPVTVGVRW